MFAVLRINNMYLLYIWWLIKLFSDVKYVFIFFFKAYIFIDKNDQLNVSKGEDDGLEIAKTVEWIRMRFWSFAIFENNTKVIP